VQINFVKDYCVNKGVVVKSEIGLQRKKQRFVDNATEIRAGLQLKARTEMIIVMQQEKVADGVT